MKTNGTSSLRRIFCMLLAAVLVLGSQPWMPAYAATTQEVAGTVLHSEDFESVAVGYVDGRIGGWDIGVQTKASDNSYYLEKTLPEGSAAEIIDSGDAARGKVMKITQKAGNASLTVDYVLPSTSGYTALEVSFDFCATDGLQVNNMGPRFGLPNPRSYITLKDNTLTAGNLAGEGWSAAYTPGQWNSVKIVAYRDSSSTPLYDVWLNGTQVAAGYQTHSGNLYAIQFLVSGAGSTGSLMIDNVIATETLADGYSYSESFDNVSAETALKDVTGWSIAGLSSSTAGFVNLGTEEEKDYALNINFQDKGTSHVYTQYSLGAAYTNLEMSFDIMAETGVLVNNIGMHCANYNQPRVCITLDGNGNVKTNDTIIGTYTPGEWYTARIVRRQHPATGYHYYDVYFGKRGEEASLIANNVKSGFTDATACFAIHTSKWSSANGNVYVDNLTVNQLPAALASDSFENLPVGTADVLSDWTLSTSARAATATVTDLGDGVHGKVLELYQTGKESDSANSLLLSKMIGDSYSVTYDSLDLTFDVMLSTRSSNTKGPQFAGSFGRAFNDTMTNFRTKASLAVRENVFNYGGTTTKAYTLNQWYTAKIAYRPVGDGTYQYSLYMDGEAIVENAVVPTYNDPVNAIRFELNRNFEGVAYVDNIVVSDPTQEPSTQIDGAVYVGTDNTTGSSWFTTDSSDNVTYAYGSEQAILLGKNYKGGSFDTSKYTTINGTDYYRMLIERFNSNYHNNTAADAIKASAISGQGDQLWCTKAATHGLDLATPAGVTDSTFASTFNAYTFRGSAVDGVSRTSYRFTNLTAGESYRFSVYGRNPFDLEGAVRFTFLDEAGNTTYTKTFNYSDFGTDGAYVSFVVKGNFTLQMDKLNTDTAVGYFGVSAFFFDELTENQTVGLTAAAHDTMARSVKLTWTEQTGFNGDVVVLRKDGADGTYSPVGVTMAGLQNYTDTGLTAGQTYTYMLCTKTGTDYSAFSKEATYTVSAYSGTTLTLTPDANEDDYTYTWATTAENTVTAKLAAAEEGVTIPEGLEVTLKLTWAFDGTTTQTYTGTTAADGTVTFAVTPEYLGKADLLVSFPDNDANGLSQSQTTGTLFVGETEWKKAPVLWHLSDAIKPGDTIGVYGYGIEQGAKVYMKLRTAGQTAATAIELDVLQYDIESSSYLMAQFPETASVGVYDLWVVNDYGTSNTMVLNAARPLFISEYEAWAGQSIQISGRVLDASIFGDAENTLVHLVKDGERYPQALTKLSPYALTFTVGELALGTYQVQVSNDGGTTWSTLESGQPLTVVAEGNDPLDIGVAWMDHFNWDNEINVTDAAYGAVANDSGDDTAAFAAAIAAAKAAGGGVVYIPDGNYRISTLDVPSYVVLMGQSKENTVLTYIGTSTSRVNMFEGDAATRDDGHIGFARFTINLSSDANRPDAFFWVGHDWTSTAYDLRLREAKEFFLYQIVVDSSDVAPVSGDANRGMAGVAIADERMVIVDCDFEGYMNTFGSMKVTKYMTVKDNTWSYGCGNNYFPAHYSFIENNTFKGRYYDLTQEEILALGGNTHGLSFGSWTHIEGNHVEQMGALDTGTLGSAMFNDGETYLAECQEYWEFGDVVNSTAASVTVYPEDGVLENVTGSGSKLYMRNYPYVYIIDGRGLGQRRQVASINYENMVITVTEAWDVNPDSTSKFVLIEPSEKSTLYNNTEANSAKGVYLYGENHDIVVANHTCTNTQGISVISQTATGSTRRFWNSSHIDIRDNTLTGVSRAAQTSHISVNTDRNIKDKDFYATSFFGVEIRNNTINGIKGLTPVRRNEAPGLSGIVMSSNGNTDNAYGDIYAVIVENNTLNTLDVGINYAYNTYGLLLKDNTFNDCTATTSQILTQQTDQTAIIVHKTEYTSASADTVYPAAYSLTLDGTIGVDYYMNLPAEITENLEDYNVVFTLPDMGSTTYTVSAASGTPKTVTLNDTEQQLYLFTCPIAAKEMTGTIYVQVVKADGTWKSEVFEYTAQTYAKYILDNAESYSAELVALVKDMLNYGTAAQEHFQYNTDVLANSILDSADKTVSTFGGISYSDFSSLPTTDESDTVGFVGATLMLESETGLRLYLNVADGTIVTAALEGTVPTGVALKQYTEKSGNGYTGYIEIAGIAAKDLDEVFTVKITASDNSTVTVQHSPMKYSYNVQKGNYDTTLQTLLAALYDYNAAANTYFN